MELILKCLGSEKGVQVADEDEQLDGHPPCLQILGVYLLHCGLF